MSDKTTLVFTYDRVGNNGKISLTAKLGDEVLAMDSLNILSANARERFAKQLCKDRPGIDRAEVDQELLDIAHEIHKAQNMPQGAARPVAELDVTHIVRPERFITAEVSGLTVAIPTLRDGRPAGQLKLHVRWKDGKREVVDMPESLTLPDGSKLWIHPTPGVPSLLDRPAWSKRARKAWLDGTYSVDAADIFQRLCKCIAHYVYFPEDAAPGTTAALALWVLLTYCYPAWSAIPYLYLGGPAGSGKTRVFEVLSRLIFRPLQSSSLSAAALFRTLHGKGGTLLYDEAERLKQNAPDVADITAMLLAGYKRGGRATRLEPTGDGKFETVEFQVFGPKAMACIRGLPLALSSRCIPVVMFRAASGSPKPRRRIDDYKERWETLRDDLHVLALDCGPDFLDLARQDDVCPKMSGRAFELWQPLLALASWVESCGADGLLELMQGYAAASIESGQEDQTPDCDEILLRTLGSLRQLGLSPIAKDVLEKAKEEEMQTFAGWSAKGAANALRRYGIETRKTQGRRSYGHITLDQLRRIQTTYNMDLDLPEGDSGNIEGDTR